MPSQSLTQLIKGSISLAVCLAFHFPASLCSTWAQETSEEQPPAAANADNWAEQYLASDPLVAMENVTLEDLRAAIADPQRRGTAIARHFKRVIGLTVEDQQTFLLEMLESDFPEVQTQAALEIVRLGLLGEVVKQILLQALRSDDILIQKAAVVGLRDVDFGDGELPSEYFEAIKAFLDSDDPQVADAASARLLDQQASALPLLLQSFRQGDYQARIRAAKLLSALVLEDQRAMLPPLRRLGELSQPEDKLEAMPHETIGKSADRAESQHLLRRVKAAEPTKVTVYFGTNREKMEASAPTWTELSRLPVLLLIFLSALVFSTVRLLHGHAKGVSSYLLPIFMILGIAWTTNLLLNDLGQYWRVDSHPGFGPRRDPEDQVYYGKCEVTIPPTHAVGVVERPMFGREDESLHVVIHQTTELPRDSFFDLVKTKVAELPRDDRSCFIFIHGFNVSFADAARRTAQIHHDLNFQGVPIFFSWPSRASLRHYFSDRNEILYSRLVIKQFLTDVRQRVDAERIHVIAHSMGADATSQAIASLGEQGKIFDQIILAAPDIDRDVFRRQLAPRLAMASNRTTMYCSRNDFALIASRTFNDALRAGDSSKGALVVRGIDTIDASDIDTDLLGHSYYGDCLPILYDLRQLLQLNLPPKVRKLTPWPIDDQLLYWTLPNLIDFGLWDSSEHLPGTDQ